MRSELQTALEELVAAGYGDLQWNVLKGGEIEFEDLGSLWLDVRPSGRGEMGEGVLNAAPEPRGETKRIRFAPSDRMALLQALAVAVAYLQHPEEGLAAPL